MESSNESDRLRRGGDPPAESSKSKLRRKPGGSISLLGFSWGILCYAGGFLTAFFSHEAAPRIPYPMISYTEPHLNDLPGFGGPPFTTRQLRGDGEGEAASTIRRAAVPPPLSTEAPKRYDEPTSNVTLFKDAFPPSISRMFQGYATIPRDSIAELIDLGVPLDKTEPGADSVLVLYSGEESFPDDVSTAAAALENCDTVKVVLHQKSSSENRCLAIMPQWESYHVHKYMRVEKPEEQKGKIDSSMPLTQVARYHSSSGKYGAGHDVPKLDENTTPFYEALVEYLQNLPAALDSLKPFLEEVMKKASNPETNALVVMTSNKGQSMLIRNFVCNAHAKGLDLSHVVVIATDKATLELCQELGLAAWYDEGIYGSFPEEAAGKFRSPVFVKFSMAKIFCVHLVMSLGYHVLHQDIDVIWNKDPLPFFDKPAMRNYDMVFQDDGDRTTPGKPYNPNSGFSFIRNNDRTVFFQGMLLRMGDVVTRKRSHQETLNLLLQEHVNWSGLRVKVIPQGHGNPFPGGVEFTHKEHRDYMKEILRNETMPYIFHMSYTKSKDDKLKYLKQFGEWYLKEDENGYCSGKGLGCCLPQPNITCHFRDRPSKIPCPDSPLKKTKSGTSFW